MKARSEDLPWLGAIVLLFALFWGPLLKIQPPLTTGDMGRDLYAFWMTFEGKGPCRDYWWAYGPLMPLYFAFWFLAAGVSLLSVRIGLGVLLLICSLLAYGTLRLFTRPPAAFLFSLAFLSLDVTYSLHHTRLRDIAFTFNQYGVFPFLLLAFYSLWKYFLTGKARWTYLGIAAVSGVALVKMSAGLAACAALVASFWLFQPRLWKHGILLSLLFGIVVAAGYGLTYWGIPLSQVSQCLTIGPAYHGGDYSPWVYFKHLILWFLVWDRERLLWLGAFSIFLAAALMSFRRGKIAKEKGPLFFWAGLSSFLFGAATSLEFFVDASIHRVDFWFFPSLVLLVGIWAEAGSRIFSRPVKTGLGVLIFFAVLSFPFLNLKEALAWRVPERFLDFPHGGVYLGGNLEDVKVIREGSRFIRERTGPEAKIIGIPYEPLYAFLSGREHAVRELLFAENMQISESREEEIIQTLETGRVPLAVVSSRKSSPEWGIGDFGKTHCRKLAAYLATRYEEVRGLGPAEEAGSPTSYAIKILERKS